MLAMQYTIRLPHDFDPLHIRKRVETRATLFDTLPGLAHKSFLFSEPDKLYAPFYIWSSNKAARSFLMEDLFKGVTETFSRPRVRTWNVFSTAYGNTEFRPAYAMMEADTIAAEANLATLFAEENARQQALAQNPALFFHAIALDTDRWEMVKYSLWKNEASAQASDSDCVQTYEVLHVSEPAADEKLQKA